MAPPPRRAPRGSKNNGRGNDKENLANETPLPALFAATLNLESNDSEEQADKEAWKGLLSPGGHFATWTSAIYWSQVNDGNLCQEIVDDLAAISDFSDPYLLHLIDLESSPTNDDDKTETLDVHDEVSDRLRSIGLLAKGSTVESTMYGQANQEEISCLERKSVAILAACTKNLYGLLEQMMKAPNVEELAHLCWGCVENYVPGTHTHSVVVITLATLAALYSSEEQRMISPRRASLLVEKALLCNGTPIHVVSDDESEPLQCHCVVKNTLGGAVFLLGQRSVAVVDALETVLLDKTAAHNGRRNAGGILMRIAHSNPLLKRRVIDSLMEAVGDDSDLVPEYRSELVAYITRFRATEALGVVEEACKKGKLDDSVCGYLDFVLRIGMETANAPNSEEATLRRMARLMQQGSMVPQDVVELNATIENTMHLEGCAKCGKQPHSGESLPTCSGCQRVNYCNAHCQRSDWDKHRNLCKAVQKAQKLLRERHNAVLEL